MAKSSSRNLLPGEKAVSQLKVQLKYFTPLDPSEIDSMISHRSTRLRERIFTTQVDTSRDDFDDARPPLITNQYSGLDKILDQITTNREHFNTFA